MQLLLGASTKVNRMQEKQQRLEPSTRANRSDLLGRRNRSCSRLRSELGSFRHDLFLRARTQLTAAQSHPILLHSRAVEFALGVIAFMLKDACLPSQVLLHPCAFRRWMKSESRKAEHSGREGEQRRGRSELDCSTRRREGTDRWGGGGRGFDLRPQISPSCEALPFVSAAWQPRAVSVDAVCQADQRRCAADSAVLSLVRLLPHRPISQDLDPSSWHDRAEATVARFLHAPRCVTLLRALCALLTAPPAFSIDPCRCAGDVAAAEIRHSDHHRGAVSDNQRKDRGRQQGTNTGDGESCTHTAICARR